MDILCFLSNNSDTVAVLIASVALGLSFISTIAAIWAVSLQRKHNRMSVRPIADFTFADYQDCIGVYLKNHGLGPMTIEKFEVISQDKVIGDNLIDLMPPKPPSLYWTDFLKEIKDRVMAPGEKRILIEIKGAQSDKDFASYRDELRRSLYTLKIRVTYKGVYNQKSLSERSLAWFGRTVSE